MIEEQREETGEDAVELRRMAEDERRELLEQVAELEAQVTVRSLLGDFEGFGSFADGVAAVVD